MSSNNKLARQRWGAASLLPDTTEAKTKKPAIKDNADVGHSTNARSKDKFCFNGLDSFVGYVCCCWSAQGE